MEESTKSIDEQVPPEDFEAITDLARNYIEGWYAADPKRMQDSLHPELVKRSVFRDMQDGAIHLRRSATAEMMVEFTKEGGGSELSKEDQTLEITVFDVFRHIGSAKVVSHKYVDYLQVAKIEGTWIIVNVLWELREGEMSE